MIQIRRATQPHLDRSFDKFLHHSTCRGDGDETTVLSLLARLDNDPWHVARQLARMPRAQAVCYITHIIDGPAVVVSSYSAGQLGSWIDLLPQHRKKSVHSRLMGRLTLGYLFIGFNAIFFLLLCASLATPLPPRNVGSETSLASFASRPR